MAVLFRESNPVWNIVWDEDAGEFVIDFAIDITLEGSNNTYRPSVRTTLALAPEVAALMVLELTSPVLTADNAAAETGTFDVGFTGDVGIVGTDNTIAIDETTSVNIGDVEDAIVLTQGEPTWTVEYNAGDDKIDSNLAVSVSVDGTTKVVVVDETVQTPLSAVEDAIAFAEGSPTWDVQYDAVTNHKLTINLDVDVDVDGTTKTHAVSLTKELTLVELQALGLDEAGA